jgi:hypothetical protein
MVRGPGNYRWSSYGVNAHDVVGGFVVPHAVYQSLGATTAKPWEACLGLSNDNFRDKMARKTKLNFN